MTKSVFNRQIIAVGVGDFKIATDGFTIETILGCCVGVCLYDNKKKIGGLLHIMLPKAPKGKTGKPAKYANTGIKEMLRFMEKDH